MLGNGHHGVRTMGHQVVGLVDGGLFKCMALTEACTSLLCASGRVHIHVFGGYTYMGWSW